MSQKEKRTKRKELLLTPSEMKAFQAAASASGVPLSIWMVQVLRAAVEQDRIVSRAPAQKTEG